jgi:transcriptional regulator with XRE-family HTH domain
MMPRIRRPSREEIRERRAAIAARARGAQLRLPEAIREIRHALGQSQEEFAKLFKLTLRQVKELESGQANPTVETLSRVGKAFGFKLGFVPQRGPEREPEIAEPEYEDQPVNRRGG